MKNRLERLTQVVKSLKDHIRVSASSFDEQRIAKLLKQISQLSHESLK